MFDIRRYHKKNSTFYDESISLIVFRILALNYLGKDRAESLQWFEWEMYPKISGIYNIGSQLVVLFENTSEGKTCSINVFLGEGFQKVRPHPTSSLVSWLYAKGKEWDFLYSALATIIDVCWNTSLSWWTLYLWKHWHK